MTSPYAHELERLREEYRRTRTEFVEVGKKLRTLTSTVTSPDGFLTMTVGPQGDLTELKFNNEKYRDMRPKELANAIQETLGKARDGLANQIRDVMPASPFANASFDDLRKPDFDWSSLMPDNVPETTPFSSRSQSRPEAAED